MAKVFLGVGHGGNDPGAVANGLKEADLNLAIGLACRDELVRHGVTVQMSRARDEDDDQAEEVRESNAFNPDYSVHIHNNAGGGDGAELFYHYKGGKGKTLAQNILDAVVALGQNSRGLKTRLNSAGNADYYGVIRNNTAPARAIIIECAFVDNWKDIQIIDTPAEQKAMGVAIAKGVLKTLGIAYKEENRMDYANHWAKDAIQEAINDKLMVGDGKGNFRPNDPMTRGEVAQLLKNLRRQGYLVKK